MTLPLASDRLYALMPAIYRIRDVDDGQTLRAFMAVLERTFSALQSDMDGLYDDWFIETCSERIVPYIAELVGVTGMPDTQHVQGTRRRRVANATTYLRSTGTLPMLQELARDLTGWPVEVVDLAGLVASTQHVQHARPERASVDVRRPMYASHAAVASVVRGVDVRSIVPDVGHGTLHSGSVRDGYNLTDIGVFFWRLQPYPVNESTPAQVGPGRYTFDPTGRDTHLFQPARTPPPGASDGAYLPLALQRTSPTATLSVSVWMDDAAAPVESSEIALVDLSRWQAANAPASVTVDPVLGRLACAPDRHVRAVSYWYAFSGDVGAGPYPRQVPLPQRPIDWRAWVGQTMAPPDPTCQWFHSLAEAIQAWNARPAGEAGVIAIADNATYAAPDDPIVIHNGSFLMLIAARPGGAEEPVTRMARPCVRGDLRVTGAPSEEPGELLIDGLLCDGALHVGPADLGRLTLAHATFVPERGGVRVEAGNPRLVLRVQRSICGPLAVLDPTARVELAQTIVDAQAAVALRAPACAVEIRGATVFGSMHVGSVDARDSLLLGRVTADRRQVGTVEYSFVPDRSRTPPRHHCQPDLALRAAPHEQHDRIRARLVPSFTSTHYGDAGYAQLTPATPSEIRAGARNDAEMGAFHLLYQPLRMTSFTHALRDFLPAGRDLGVFFVS